MHKITPKQYEDFRKKFFAGGYPHQRYGQAFMNNFFPLEIDSRIFYGTDQIKVQNEIMNKYIEWEKGQADGQTE
ncbi:MAG TPA: hypothetical protein VJ583_03505 [Nitrososphaeraceae archaeon]|nr:hypothetical protein [Nitrososphaeraceae archaeon]